MKYYTLEYDMNRPYNRQITMPLLSRQGVAVAVFKDGRKLDLGPGDVEVQGAEAGPEHGGYLTFELSSGAEPGLSEKAVSLQKPSTAEGSGVYVATIGPNSMLPIEGVFDLSALSTVEFPVDVKAEDLTGFDVKYTLSSAGGVSADVGLPTNMLQVKNSSGTLVAYQYLLSGEGGRLPRTWYVSSTLTAETVTLSSGCSLVGGSKLMFSDQPAVAQVSAEASIDTKDSVSGQFKLQVQAEDLGWFEPGPEDVGEAE